MAQPNNINSPNARQLTACQAQIEPVLAHLRQTLDDSARLAETALEEQRESLEADICLATRSAYFDFYTWVVLNGVIDPPAERELNDLFLRSLALMHPGRFKDSVQSRYEEFKTKCKRVHDGFVDSDTGILESPTTH
jgi:hypothetical protein